MDSTSLDGYYDDDYSNMDSTSLDGYDDDDYSNMNSTSLDESYNDTSNDMYVMKCITITIISIGLPLTLVVLWRLFSLVRNDHVAPIYVINLLISDLLQFCYLIVEVVEPENRRIYEIFFYIYSYSLGASVGFMVCVALERYLVIAHPLWYHCRRTIKASVVICVVVWALPLVYVLPLSFGMFSWFIIFLVFFLLPFPLFIFFLGGTLKALPASRVPSDEKRRIVGLLVLVLLIYTLLFLPSIIFLRVPINNKVLFMLLDIFLRLSPFADLVLYVFMKKEIIDKLLASVCCCRMDSNDSSRSITMTTHTEI